MKEKLARLNAVRKLIMKEKIKSQDTLLERLQKEGFAITQATLSRYLRELKVSRVSDGMGSYIYAIGEDNYAHDFFRGCISIEWSGNIVIVKTHSGHSDPVAVALDSFGFNEILGTIAGNDNTVAVFLREGYSGEDFMKRIKETIPEL